MNNQKQFCLFLTLCVLIFSGCDVLKKTTKKIDDNLIEFNFFQINDVYEISPLEGGKVGGMTRVAAYYKKVKAENPNTLFVMAGDFLNPSLIGTLPDDSKPKIKGRSQLIAGKQMIEVMNVCGVDLAAFGNHEFDLPEALLQERINASEFDWIATNLQHKIGNELKPFHKEKNGVKTDIADTYTWNIKDEDGTQLSIGIFSATINSNPKKFVQYDDYTLFATRAANQLKAKSDMVVGLTHLLIDEDTLLAKQLPYVPLIMGGHEHHNMKHTIGNVVVTKADANAKTAYLHKFIYNTKTKSSTLTSTLIPIDDNIKPDAETQKVVAKWEDILNKNLSEIYPTPNEKIYTATVPLDGRSVSIRSKPTNLGTYIAKGFAEAAKKKAVAGFINAGAIRIDDQLEGDVLAIDIFRVLPFGGEVVELDVKGETLIKFLQKGIKDMYGKGSYLQSYNVSYDEAKKQWQIGNEPIENDKIYHIAMNYYVYRKYDLLNKLPVERAAQGDRTDTRSDLRLAVINYLKGL